MYKRLVSFAVVLAIAFTAFLLCFSGYVNGQAKVFFDNLTAICKIKKSIIYVGVFYSSIIFIIVIVIVMVSRNKKKNAKVSLQGSEEILSILINCTPDLIYFKDAEGRYLEANDSMLELFGFDRRSFRGKQRWELDAKSTLFRTVSENCCNLDERAWDKGSALRTTSILNMPGGVKKTYDVIKAPIFYTDGRRKGIVTLARDITIYKEAEEKFEKKEKILRATLNAIDYGILVVDNNRKLLEANDLYFNMWNIPWDIYSLNNETANLKFIKKQLVDPGTFEAWVNFTYEVTVTEHYTAELIKGRVFDVFSTPLMDKEHIVGRVWSFRDITTQVNAENELHRSEEKYRTLVELCPDAIFVSVNSKIVFSNMTGVRMLGAKSREDIYQKNILDLSNPDTRALTEQQFNDIINGKGKQFISEHKMIQLDGNSIDTESVCSMITFRGESAIMCAVRDISERKRNEEMKYKMDENMKLVSETLEYDKIRTEFFANISHELKTPLNIIIGTLQLFEMILKNQNSDGGFDKLTRYTAIMKQNCFRLLRMLSNLIYVTEIDTGIVAMHVQNNDLAQILNSIMPAAERFIESKGVQLELHIDSISLEVACDYDKIERVILNLLSNAVKFTEKGGRISVSLYKRNDCAFISVKDTGIGIPDEMKEVIFQRFRQVDKSFTRKCEGSGIGLFLVKSLVEMHRGSVEVSSAYGKGSEFIVKLPLLMIDNDEIALTDEETAGLWSERVNIEFSDIY